MSIFNTIINTPVTCFEIKSLLNRAFSSLLMVPTVSSLILRYVAFARFQLDYRIPATLTGYGVMIISLVCEYDQKQRRYNATALFVILKRFNKIKYFKTMIPKKTVCDYNENYVPYTY